MPHDHPPGVAQADATCLPSADAQGFSIVEMLVVVAIIAILIGLVSVGGGALADRAKARDTEGLLKSLDQAIVAYKVDVKQNRVPNAANVFLGAPPDDPYVLQSARPQENYVSGCRIQIARGAFVPDAVQLRDQRDAGTGRLSSPSARRFGDIRAMVLAMRLRSPAASAILDNIDARFRVRDNLAALDAGDGLPPTPLDYYVDAWGTPIEYFSTCICDPSVTTPREEASDRFVHANNGDPLLVSYGPNGPDQFSADFFADPTIGDTSLVADFYEEISSGEEKGQIDNEYNNDNVYSSEQFVERMR